MQAVWSAALAAALAASLSPWPGRAEVSSTGAVALAPEALLRAAKDATGGEAWNAITTWHERGTLSAGGLTGSYEEWIDLPHLKQAISYRLGPATGGGGWDGKQSWTTDSSGQIRIETSAEATAEAIQDAYRTSFAFFFPERWPAAFAAGGARQADGKTYQAVRITPKDAEPFELWIDMGTRRIAREVQLTGAQPHSFLLESWRKVGEILAPATVIDRIGGDPKFDQIAAAADVELSVPVSDARFAPPPPPADDAEWPPGKDRVTLPLQLLNNHIYVEASVNGRRPAPFVFDTGATNVLEAGHAAMLGVRIEGALPAAGFGASLGTTGLGRAKTVSLGGLTLPDQVFATENSPGWIKVEGAESAGLLGYEFAKRAVLTIDYAHGTMTFTKPQAFSPPAGVTAVPFAFYEHVPMVEASLDGAAGEFEIDTGSRGALTLMHPFTVSHGLLEKYRARRFMTVGYGVGGPTQALLARGGTFQIGPVSITEPVLEFTVDSRGAGAAARTAGNIGGDILKRYTLTLDYGHRQLWLEPNELAGQKEVFDRSGLWIGRADDGSIAVLDVAGASAASEAGIATGDRITAVDGAKASSISLSDLRDRFKGPVGTQFTLAIISAKGERSTTLTLADQV